MTTPAPAPSPIAAPAPSTPLKRWVPTAEMAAAACCCRASLFRWARRGLIPSPASLGRSCHRWPIDDVLAALAARAAAATPAPTAPGKAEAAA